ncbi:MAG TPA: YdcF family protein [Hyphomonadaceae bacterium]|nr:YdcF family protein [Hyphomonadaceae bacterium]
MDLFYIASKVGWFFLTPSNLLLLAMAVGILLLRWARTRKLGLRLAAGGAIATALVTVLPVSEWLLASLERRFPAYEPCKSSTAQPLAGIILLGGAISSEEIDGRIIEDLGGSADRIRKAAQLAHEYPSLPVLVSGGQAFPRKGARPESVATADLLKELGVEESRLKLETASRTTAENAAFVKSQAGTGAWLLVTSAFHMPRSVATFRKAGIDVIPVPTDWMVDDNRPLLTMNALDRLGKLDLAVHEYLGLAAYWAARHSSSLLPAPDRVSACDTPAAPAKAS